jgi:hypothetical protein
MTVICNSSASENPVSARAGPLVAMYRAELSAASAAGSSRSSSLAESGKEFRIVLSSQHGAHAIDVGREPERHRSAARSSDLVARGPDVLDDEQFFARADEAQFAARDFFDRRRILPEAARFLPQAGILGTGTLD